MSSAKSEIDESEQTEIVDGETPNSRHARPADISRWIGSGTNGNTRAGIDDLLPDPDDSDIEILRQRNAALERMNKSLLANKDDERRIIDYLIRRVADEMR